jgi:hypothetical protein
MAKKLLVKSSKRAIPTATRVSVHTERLVYVLSANKALNYEFGKKSKIAYIGTTEKGIHRIAESIADKAGEILTVFGVHSLEARIITCTPKKHVKTWRILESACLLAFREKFGSVPKYNKHGIKLHEDKEFQYFSKQRIHKIIDELS